VQCLNHIKVLEDRLSAATDRVALASELVYQKEVTRRAVICSDFDIRWQVNCCVHAQIFLRNTAASLKAEELKLKASSRVESTTSEDSDDAVAVGVSLGDLQIRPEVRYHNLKSS
jgi:hypothetical protein